LVSFNPRHISMGQRRTRNIKHVIIIAMKKSQLFLASLALPLDYLALVLAGLSAYFLRFESFVTDIRPIMFYLPVGEYLPILLSAAIIWLAIFALAGLYQIGSRLKFYDELRRVFLACSTGLALIIILFFFNQSLFSSRFIVLAFWGLAILYVGLERGLVRRLRSSLYRRGWALDNVMVVGGDVSTQELVKLFNNNPGLGYRVVATMSNFDPNTDVPSNLDEVLLADVNTPSSERVRLWEFCLQHHLGFKYVADIFNAQLHNVVMHTWAGVPVVEIKKTPLDGWGRIIKRLFDLLSATLLLVVLSPFLLILALMILVKYGRPLIVALPRIGEKGRPLVIHKFRSMVVGADKMKQQLYNRNERADGPLFKLTDDPRVTPLGRWLRKWSFDELPQLWDVLRGKMSLVGPRPHEPAEVAKYQLHHHKLLNIKPGITGLAQISGRSSLSFEEEARLDTLYIEDWSLGHDILILIKTVIVVWQGKGAV